MPKKYRDFYLHALEHAQEGDQNGGANPQQKTDQQGGANSTTRRSQELRKQIATMLEQLPTDAKPPHRIPNQQRKRAASPEQPPTPPKAAVPRHTALAFHTGPIPQPKIATTKEEKAKELHATKDIVAKFTTKEKILKMAARPAARKENTPHGTPEIGDVRRYYDRQQTRYVTWIVIASKEESVNMENLDLALANLRTQADTLDATSIHMQIPQPNLRNIKQLDFLLALERAFIDSNLTVHVWTLE